MPNRSRKALTARYGLAGAAVTAIPRGVETGNCVVATAGGGKVSAKAYSQRARPHLAVMEGRIELSERGRAAGSPTPAVHPELDGALISRHARAAVSVGD